MLTQLALTRAGTKTSTHETLAPPPPPSKCVRNVTELALMVSTSRAAATADVDRRVHHGDTE